jgi:hypothetical protein
MAQMLPVTQPVTQGLTVPLTGRVLSTPPIELPTPVISLQPNAPNTLYLEATGASATSPAGDTEIADTVVDAVVADQYFTAPSEDAGPVVDVVSGLTTLAVAGTSVLTDDSDALALDSSWTMFALVKGTNGRLFSTSQAFQSAPRVISSAWNAYNSAGSAAPICTGNTSLWHVLMIEKVPGVSLTGRYNNGGEGAIVPYDDSGSTQGIVFFVQAAIAPYGGHFTGSVARLDIIEGVLNDTEKAAYHDVFAALGAGIIGT